MWDTLKKDFKGHTQAVQNELRNQLALAKCRDNKNIHKHVDHMQYMLEELSGMGLQLQMGSMWQY
jgi:hypothetical protein